MSLGTSRSVIGVGVVQNQRGGDHRQELGVRVIGNEEEYRFDRCNQHRLKMWRFFQNTRFKSNIRAIKNQKKKKKKKFTSGPKMQKVK